MTEAEIQELSATETARRIERVNNMHGDTLSYEHPKYQTFIDGLVEHLFTDETNNCDNTHTVSRQVLYALGFDMASSLAWLKENGGCCCDCEVIFNVDPRNPHQQADLQTLDIESFKMKTQILCSQCFDKQGASRILTIIPRSICALCKRLCLGYKTDVS